MFAPQSNKARCLYTIWTKPVGGKLRVYIATEAFFEFFDIPREKASQVLGSGGWLFLNLNGAQRLASDLKSLLEQQPEST